MICGNDEYSNAGNFGNGHLKKIHNITMAEYYNMFFKKDEQEGKCLFCGKETKLKSLEYGYHKFCSVNCARKDLSFKNMIKQKRKEYYENISDEDWSAVVVRRKVTMTKKSEEERNDALEKRKKTNSNKPEDVVLEIKNRGIITQIRKHINKIGEKIKDNNLEFLDYDLVDAKYIFKCNVCNSIFKIKREQLSDRFRHKSIICINCNPISSGFSSQEKKLLNFVKENYQEEILENDRTVLSNNRELDIYLLNINLALEFNGLYWHSDENKPNNYHINKTNETESKNIHLLQIYEDDWNFKNDIVKSNILKLLGKCGEINSNNLDLKEIDNKTCSRFLKQNSLYDIQDFDICLGLFDDKKLLYVACFKSLDLNNYELIDSRDILNYKVNGALDRILRYFVKKYQKKKDKRRVSKNSDKIKELDESKLLKIYDSGKLKFVYDSNKV